MATDGTRLWCSDRSKGKVYLYTDKGWGSLPGWQKSAPGPITWDGEKLWVVVEESKQIVAVDGDLGERIATAPIPPAALHEVPSITGLTWDGRTLWLATGCGLCSSLYRVNVETGKTLQRFFPSCEPRGLLFADSLLVTIGYNGPKLPDRLMVRRLGKSPKTVITHLALYDIKGLEEGSDPTALLLYRGRLVIADRKEGKIAPVQPVLPPVYEASDYKAPDAGPFAEHGQQDPHP